MTSPSTAPAGAASPVRSMIQLEGVTKIYRMGEVELRALDDVDLSIAEGELVAIMGPSGSGKSTMMNILGCLDIPTEGSYHLDGIDVAARSDNELAAIRNHKIGFVFQSFNLIPTLTARENITLPGSLAGAAPSREWLDAVIDTVGIRDRLSHRPAELSGGQQQRVAMARALASQPTLVFADEPTGNLDSKAGAELLEFMRESVDELGQTIVMVTHDPVAAGYTDATVVLADGHIVEGG
jgi:putative ABC transport system ATP-binding protein